MARTQVQSELIATNAISGTIIADNAITATHIATNSISGTLVQDSGIVTSMIAANNVTSTKIVTDAVLTRHIADDQVTGDKLTNNITIAGTLASTGVLTANAGVVVDNITIDGTEIDLSSGDLTIDVAGTISLDTDSGGIYFKDDGTTIGEFINSSSDFMLKSAVQDKDILLKGNDGGSTITALQLDMSEAGAATFNSTINGLTLAAGSVATSTSQNFALNTPNSLRINIDSNDSATDQVFVVGHNRTDVGTTSSLLVVQEDGKVGIGTATPDEHVTIDGGSDVKGILNIRSQSAGTTYNGGVIAFKGYHANPSDGSRTWFEIRGLKENTTGGSVTGRIEMYLNPGNNSMTEVFKIESNGDTYTNDGTVHSLASDSRVKSDVADLTDGLTILNQLRPVTYKYNDKSEFYNPIDETTTRYGFIADEVKTVAPQYIKEGKGKVDGVEVDDFKTLSQTKMIPMLVKAIQELEARIVTLEG